MTTETTETTDTTGITDATGAPWIPSLALHIDSIDQEPRLSSGDWRQDAAYPEPLWTATAADLARRVSIENLDRLYALQLISTRAEETWAPLLGLGGWSGWSRYRIGAVEAGRPVEEGFLRRLRLWRGSDDPAQPVDPTAVVRAFIAAERARVGDMERWLVARHGWARPAGEIFAWIDYPAFDSGHVDLGFALLLHGPELHVWSRVVHAHK